MTDGYKIKRVLTRINEVYNDTQGPCPEGFHVPTNIEWQSVLDIFGGYPESLFDYTKIPPGGYRSYTNGKLYSEGQQQRYWSSVEYSGGYVYAITLSGVEYGNDPAGYGYNIRPFKNTPVIPDSSWTALYSNKVYHKPDLGLISLSSDGTTWITIADKNLGATTVWNNGDTVSESNCGKYYQRGNNYGFDGIGGSNPVTSSTQVNVGSYGPGNYYSSSTFITGNSGIPYTGTYSNLRGGVTQGSGTRFVEKQIYPAGWKPNANTTLYLPLNGSTKDEISGTTYSSSNITYTTWSGDIKCASFNGNGKINLTTTPDFEQGTGELTILAWFTLNSVDGDRRAICLHKQNTYFLQFGMNYSTPRFGIRNSLNDSWTNGSSTLSTGTKYLFSFTAKENGSATMYINGVQSATISIGTFTSSTFDFGQYIGLAYDGSSCYWNGTLKDVIIEKKAWTADEVLAYYNQTK